MKNNISKGGLFGYNRRSRKNKIKTCYDKINKLDIKHEIDDIILKLKNTYQDNELLDNYEVTINKYLYLLTDNKYSSKIFSYSNKNREEIEKKILELLGKANVIVLRIISHKEYYNNIVKEIDIQTDYNNISFNDARENLMKDIRDLKDILININSFYDDNKNNTYLKKFTEKNRSKSRRSKSRRSKSRSRSRTKRWF
jgi:hypothetical protein